MPQSSRGIAANMASSLPCHTWSAGGRRTWGSRQRCRSSPWREARHRWQYLFVLSPNCSEWPDSFQDRLYIIDTKKVSENYLYFDSCWKAIFSLTLQPSVALLSDLKKEDERRSVVVWPVVVGHSTAKVPICVICRTLWCVYNVVLIFMFTIQKICHLKNENRLSTLD